MKTFAQKQSDASVLKLLFTLLIACVIGGLMIQAADFKITYNREPADQAKAMGAALVAASYIATNQPDQNQFQWFVETNINAGALYFNTKSVSKNPAYITLYFVSPLHVEGEHSTNYLFDTNAFPLLTTNNPPWFTNLPPVKKFPAPIFTIERLNN